MVLSVKYDFDAAGHAVKASNAALATQVFWQLLEADQGYRVKKEQLGGDTVTERGYGLLTGWLSDIVTNKATETIQSELYTYLDNGVTHDRTDVVSGRYERFTYDAIDRLTGVYGPNDSLIRGFEYDSLSGRITSQTALGNYSYVSDGRDWVESAGPFTYDRDGIGNIHARSGPGIPGGTQYIDYTMFNLPSQIRNGTETDAPAVDFAYDAEGRRVLKRGPSSATFYAGDLYQATVPAANPSDTAHRFMVYAGGRAVAQVDVSETSGTSGEQNIRYLHDDAWGSISAVTGDTTARREFAPFGDTSSGTVDAAAPYGFTGQEHDVEVGLVNMHGRMYDPVLSQFLTPDPILQRPEGQGLNRYAYVFNSPTNYVDPTGFSAEDVLNNIGEYGTLGLVAGGRAAAIGLGVYGFATGAGSAASLGGGVGLAAVETAWGIAAPSALGVAASTVSGGVAIGLSVMNLAIQARSPAVFPVKSAPSTSISSASGPGTPSVGKASRSAIAPVQESAARSNELGMNRFDPRGAPRAPLAEAVAHNTEDFDLLFNGMELVWYGPQSADPSTGARPIVEQWAAVSGRSGYGPPAYQGLHKKGPIPEGFYRVKQADLQDYQRTTRLERAKAAVGLGPWPGGLGSWGRWRIWLEPIQGTITLGREGFSIHGGAEFGSAGCIDLAPGMDSFADKFREYGQDLILRVQY